MKGKIFGKQLLIFIVYLLISSSFLFNHKGGADIAFLFIMIIIMFFHFIYSFKKSFFQEKEVEYIIAVIFIALIFGFFHEFYLKFMWWFTNLFKNV
jgi:hypothetical protein